MCTQNATSRLICKYTIEEYAIVLRRGTAMDLDVVNMFVIAGSTLAIPILAFMASFLLWPAALIKVYYWYWRRALGLQVAHAEYKGYQFCYSHRGKPGNRPSILMLHGFSAHKDMWLSVVKFLQKNVHIICVDMPGHGGTTRTSAVDYSIEGQVKRIRQFVESTDLNKKPFHLVGTSMGGNVAGLKYPTESNFVKSLRELEKTQDTQSIPLIPSTTEEMEEMLKLCSFVRFKIPQQILQGLVDVRVPHNDFYREVFMEIVGEESRHSLHENMHLISTPLQVIWGKHDQVVDVSGASVLAEALPGCQVDLLDKCGHSVVMERPRKTAQLIMDFIITQQNAGCASSKKLS
ncbi:monoacylglycerol lipase ABHD6 isoform X2 [Alosa sapidissima]|uniref:monoacylglycerol lipase ABHD6 isoform X2 n=1 Tax=Alosa sapidissima TaxID=34773 RepID=UPI001C093857|nr:monoacylglycerol lipase ABHD6 isoform X2 [Alosa sapidissima]